MSVPYTPPLTPCPGCGAHSLLIYECDECGKLHCWRCRKKFRPRGPGISHGRCATCAERADQESAKGLESLERER